MGALPSVDVCVLVKNEVESIAKCLDSLLASDYPNFRILICDGRSTDGTLEVIQEYCKKHSNIILHIQKSSGCGAARQELMGLVKADYVTWTDGGSIVDKNWLRELVVPLLNSDEKVAGSGGYNYVISNGSVLAQCLGVSPIGVHADEIAPGIAVSLAGNNVCYKTEVLRQNPWAESMIYGDDYEMSLRLRQKGYKLILVQGAKAYVRTQESFETFHSWVKRKTRGEVTLYHKFKSSENSLKNFVRQTKMALLKRLAALSTAMLLLVLMALTPYTTLLAVILLGFVIVYLVYLFKRRFHKEQLGEKVFIKTYILFPFIDFIFMFLYAFYVWKYSKSTIEEPQSGKRISASS